jgi:PKD repeat protein
LWPLPLILLGAASFLIPGCDKLVTQVNNNTVFDSTTGQYCLTCHADTISDSLIQVPTGQWTNSKHSSPDLLEATVLLNGKPYQVNACGQICHTSQGYIKYTSSGQSTYQPATPSVIGCATCHLPHTGVYGNWSADSLRGARQSVTLVNDSVYAAGKSNMCVICHKAKDVAPATGATVKLSGDFGPHFSGQAEVLAGYGGYHFTSDTVSPSHFIVKSRDGCLSCHFGMYTSGRMVGNGQGFLFGEHTFRLEDKTTNQQFKANCISSDCHQITTFDQGFYASASIAVLDTLADSLRTLLTNAHILVPSDTNGLEFYSDSTFSADAARILYNYLLYRMDGSHGVHNPNYMHLLLSQSVARWDSLPRANFGLELPAGQCVPETILFTDSSTGSIDHYVWRFGDGDTSTEVSPEHVYLRRGSFTPKLIVSGPGGIDSMIAVTTIVTDSLPFPKFTISPTGAAVGATVTFIDSSLHADSRIWDFGDGSPTVTDSVTTHVYTTSATFSVKLLLQNACGVDSLMKDIIITP